MWEQHISFIQLFNNLFHYSPQPGFLVSMAQRGRGLGLSAPRIGGESFWSLRRAQCTMEMVQVQSAELTIFKQELESIKICSLRTMQTHM